MLYTHLILGTMNQEVYDRNPELADTIKCAWASTGFLLYCTVLVYNVI